MKKDVSVATTGFSETFHSIPMLNTFMMLLFYHYQKYTRWTMYIRTYIIAIFSCLWSLVVLDICTNAPQWSWQVICKYYDTSLLCTFWFSLCYDLTKSNSIGHMNSSLSIIPDVILYSLEWNIEWISGLEACSSTQTVNAWLMISQARLSGGESLPLTFCA